MTMKVEKLAEKTESKMTEAAQSLHEIEGKVNNEAQKEKKGELMMRREKVCPV